MNGAAQTVREPIRSNYCELRLRRVYRSRLRGSLRIGQSRRCGPDIVATSAVFGLSLYSRKRQCGRWRWETIIRWGFGVSATVVYFAELMLLCRSFQQKSVR
jgi:hypothetical protein